MKSFLCILTLCTGLATLPARAQSPEESAADIKALLQHLFSQETTQEELLGLIKQANKIGVPRQQIIEAKLIWGLRHQDTPFLVKILPEVEVLAEAFDPTSAAALTDAEAVKAFIAYIKALQAGEANDEAGFKKNILEAIWLNPKQAPVFIQAIDKIRLEMKISGMIADLTIPLTTSMGEATTLADQLGGQKALLLDFWASWCGPCMNLMPSLKKKAEKLSAHGIVVAAMNKDDENAEHIAERIRKEQNATLPWLVEPADRPYSKLFAIDSIPRMILISPEGKVLFNGHPEDPALWTALKKIDSSITGP